MKLLYHTLKKIRKTSGIPFHMPGSKGGKAIPRLYKRDIFSLDFTEIDGTDNLLSPNGILKDSLKDIAKIYGAAHSFMLLGGASSGILSAFAFMASLGGKVLVDRNCHISAINAISIFGLSPVFITPSIIPDHLVPGRISSEQIEESLKQNSNIKSVYLTSPNYYGICSDIPAISAVCKKYGVILAVDSAHGAHFAFSPLLPQNVAEFADISVMSVHKTLPAPTQTALLHISENVDFSAMQHFVNMFQTTSPSYILMAYTDFAVKYMHRKGKGIFSRLEKNISFFKSECPLPILETDDFSRLVISGGFHLDSHLKKHGIMPEMADTGNVVLICGKGNIRRHFKKLLRVLQKYVPSKKAFSLPPFPSAAQEYKNPGLFTKHTLLELGQCEGFVSAGAVTVYPPCVPILLPGEKISCEVIDYIHLAASAGGKITGMEDGKLKVLE